MRSVIIVSITLLFVSFAFATGKDNQQLFEKKCNKCHNLERSLNENKDLEAWKRAVKRMAKYSPGLISEKEAESIAEYLADRGQKKGTSDDKADL